MIVETVKDEAYSCVPQTVVMKLSKYETKTLIMSRFHMLECGFNYKGKLSDRCASCDVLDDENHRLNYCTKYRDLNHCDNGTKVEYSDIYSDDPAVLRCIFGEISKVWNLRNTSGAMNVA